VQRKQRDIHTLEALRAQRRMPPVFDILLTAAMVGKTVVELPWRGREMGAVQVSADDGGTITATLVVEGSLKDDEASYDDTLTRYVLVPPGLDTDYDATAVLTFTNEKTIKFIGPGKMYSRIRVRLTALTGTNARLRVL
jgi:hypothetical protein